MRKAFLKRTSTGDTGTFGTLFTDTGFSCKTLELPWRDNHPNESAIPAGTYFCVFRQSPKFGPCYELLRVPNRTDILIHPGNHAGDKSKGLLSDVLGCILVGQKVGEVLGQLGVQESRDALAALLKDLGRCNFEIEIVDSFN